MRTKGIEIVTAVFLGILIPVFLIGILQDRVSHRQDPSASTQTNSYVQSSNDKISVLQTSGAVVEMPIEEYVLAVVLSEMPAHFEPEALKAQAVVARTYALRRKESKSRHVEAAVCVNSSCCQGYCSITDYLDRGGKQIDVNKIRFAVEATAGLVLVYNNKLIDATYFSCSGGSTEDAKDVWGTEIPYLQSVESPGEEGATQYVDTVQYSVAEFIDRLGIALSPNSNVRIDNITHTVGGGVDSLVICGKTFAGTQIRKLLKLRSTSFYISVLGDTVTITTKGFGHRVGMSQYGADAMAVNGSSFQQILSHYYQGSQLIPFDFN